MARSGIKVFGWLALVALASVAVKAARAEDKKNPEWKKKHPRQAEVLNRANREQNKNNAAAVNGKITNQQAQKLDREDQAIKREDRRDAAANGGHITPAEQARMNRQENAVNAQRRADERKDAAANPAGGAPATPAAAPATPAAVPGQ